MDKFAADCLNAVNISEAESYAEEVSSRIQAKPDATQAKEEPDTSCLVANVRGQETPSLLELLKGVWYFAADVNRDPKIYIQSAVVRLTNGSTPTTLNVEYYAQKESDRRCVGPAHGVVEVIDETDPTIKVRVTVSEGASLHGAPTNYIECASSSYHRRMFQRSI